MVIQYSYFGSPVGTRDAAGTTPDPITGTTPNPPTGALPEEGARARPTEPDSGGGILFLALGVGIAAWALTR